MNDEAKPRRKKKTPPKPPEPGSPLDVGEVTVFEDGHVEVPTPKEEAPVAPPEEKVAVPPTVEEVEKPPGKPRPSAPRKRAGVSATTSEAVKSKPAQAPPQEKAPTPAAKPPAEMPKPALKQLQKLAGYAGTSHETRAQVVSSLPYGLTAGVGVAIFWVIVAFAEHGATRGIGWSQVPILTAGLVVPWAMFKGSTARKRSGMRVWKEPPPARWISLPSVLITAALFPVINYLAYKILFQGGSLSFGKFLGDHLKVGDIVLIVCSLVLACGVPFILGRGKARSLPRIRKKKREQPEESKEENAATPDTPPPD